MEKFTLYSVSEDRQWKYTILEVTRKEYIITKIIHKNYIQVNKLDNKINMNLKV